MHNEKTHIIVCGGKTEHPQEKVDGFILGVLSELGITDCEIVSGGCKGADISGEKFAEAHGFEVVRFLPDWRSYGRSAGIRRNAEMVNYISQFECSLVIAFWNGQSRGTKFTIELARKKGIPVYIYCYKSRK